MSFLRIDTVSKALTGVEIIHSCSMEIEPGQRVGLIGPNGAGKTTLFRVISGELHADVGSVSFVGRDITRFSPDRIGRLGLVRTFQIPALFDEMSVIENLLVAAPGQVGERFWAVWFARKQVRRQEAEVENTAWNVLRSLNLDLVANNRAADLSGGQKKLLELGRALMAQPKLLLLDEPVAGVHPKLINDIAGAIRRLQKEGFTFLIVEHNMDFIFGNCEKIYVMAEGTILLSGSPSAVRSDQRVLDAYLGVV